MATRPLTQADAFIEEELRSFAAYLVERAKVQIIRRRLRMDDELLNSLAATAAREGLNLVYKPRGRYQDMGAGRGYHKGRYVGKVKDTRLLKGRKPRKWYSPTVYGAVYGTLVNNLSNKYIQALATGMRETIAKP